MIITNSIYSIELPDNLTLFQNDPDRLIAFNRSVGNSQYPRIVIDLVTNDTYTETGDTIKEGVFKNLPQIRFQAKVTATEETEKNGLPCFVVRGITDAEFNGERLQVFYLNVVVVLNEDYSLEMMLEADLELQTEYEPLFLAALESLQCSADKATCEAAVAAAAALEAAAEAIAVTIEKDDEKPELPEIPAFQIPDDSKDFVEISGIRFEVSATDSSLSIPSFSKELCMKVVFTTTEMEKGRALGVIDDYIDEAETISQLHIEFSALGIYNHGKPTGKFEIENGKYLPAYTYCRLGGFDYGLEFNGNIHIENEWVAFLGYLKKSYENKSFPVTIYKRFTNIPQLEWEHYTFTSMEEALQAPSEKVRYLTLNTPTFKEFPKEIMGFTNLIEIKIVADGNTDRLALQQLPEDIGSLSQLKEISINKSSIKQLPESMGDLHQLEKCFLIISDLETIPEGFWQLPKLKYLYLANGKISSLPDNILLNKLEVLDVSGNLLTTIPASLCLLPAIRKIDLNDNPLESLPEAIRKVKEVALALKDKKRLMDYSYKGANNSGVVKWKDAIYYAKSDKELLAEVDAVIKKMGLTSFKKALRSLVKKAVSLRPTVEEDYSHIGNHRFGGMPDLPASIAYPEFMDDDQRTCKYEFIGQINCESLAPLQEYLPRTGTLFFFLETIHSLYGNYAQPPCKVIYVADNSSLESGKRFSFTADQYFEMMEGAYTAYQADAVKCNSAPAFYAIHTNSYLLQGDAELLAKENDLLDNLYEFEEPINGDTKDYQINGHVFTQHESPELQAAAALKGDPEDWTVLLKVPSLGDFQWGDAGDLFFVIHKSDLAKGDFSNVYVGLESS